MASSGEHPEDDTGYKPPAKKSLEEIMNQDKEDESLNKYKAMLLGNVDSSCDDGGANFEPVSMSLLIKDQDDQTFSLDKESLAAAKDTTLTIIEDAKYRIKIGFKVKREIVAGVKFVTKIKKGVAGKENKEMLGSYGPKGEIQFFTTAEETAPSGMMLRGTYECTSKFVDDDKVETSKWKWNLKITK